MTKQTLLLIGAGAHSHACIDVIEQQGLYKIAGLVGLPEEVNIEILGYRVIATDDELPNVLVNHKHALISVGQVDSPDARMSLYFNAKKCGFTFPTIIAPGAYVSPHAQIGAGTIVMHSAIVNAGASVGENCIINTRALIEHDAFIGDHCHVSTGAIVNGSAKIAPECFIGSGSVIKDGLELGRRCVVGMGLSVRHNQAANTIFTGQ